MARLADALKHPEDRDEAATAIRGLIERIVLSPGEKWGEVHATLHGDLGTILEWTATGDGKNQGGTSRPKCRSELFQVSEFKRGCRAVRR